MPEGVQKRASSSRYSNRHIIVVKFNTLENHWAEYFTAVHDDRREFLIRVEAVKTWEWLRAGESNMLRNALMRGACPNFFTSSL